MFLAKNRNEIRMNHFVLMFLNAFLSQWGDIFIYMDIKKKKGAGGKARGVCASEHSCEPSLSEAKGSCWPEGSIRV